MTRTDSHTAPPATTLHWWAVAVAVVALAVPLPDGWNALLQVAALLFAIVVVCIVRGRTARAIAAAVVIVVGAVVCIQIVSQVATLGVERSFTDDAVLVR